MPNQTVAERTLPWRCPKCGRAHEALYRGARYAEAWERDADIDCANGCALPAELTDAIANWLDARADEGAGVDREP